MQIITSKRDDVRASEQRLKRNTCCRKGAFCPFFPVKDADNANDPAFGVLVNPFNGNKR